MRLINVQTENFEEVWDEADLSYAILSHRWTDEEVSYQDFYVPSAKGKKGYAKINSACIQAIHDGLNYLWIDTCCINKDSSAEVAEAINSMYRWYQNATVCYAHLADVDSDQLNEQGLDTLATSDWFSRGWTLQELLAPSSVVFYDQSWQFLGTKQTLSEAIAKATGIDVSILEGESIFNRSIAQRMSWASSRKTTRVEDMAYSLLGIFNVNIPVLYGEGPKAFIRLQEEIIRQHDDHSIFAWAQDSDEHPGLLARSPKAFESCRHVRNMASRGGRPPYSLTNRGLSIQLDAVPWSVDTYLVKLHCVDQMMHVSEHPLEQYRMGLFLRRLEDDDSYARVRYANQACMHVPESLWESRRKSSGKSASQSKLMKVIVRQSLPPGGLDSRKERVNGFRLTNPDLLERLPDGTERFKVSAQGWNVGASIMSITPGQPGTVGVVDIGSQNRKIKIIKLGFDFDFNPVCFIAESAGTMHPHMPQGNGPPGTAPPALPQGLGLEQRTQLETIHERSCFDEAGWSKIRDGRAFPLQYHHGLWALKADRVHGLFVRLADEETSSTLIQIKRGEFGERLVWDVHISGLKDSFIRKINNNHHSSSNSNYDPNNPIVARNGQHNHRSSRSNRNHSMSSATTAATSMPPVMMPPAPPPPPNNKVKLEVVVPTTTSPPVPPPSLMMSSSSSSARNHQHQHHHSLQENNETNVATNDGVTTTGGGPTSAGGASNNSSGGGGGSGKKTAFQRFKANW